MNNSAPNFTPRTPLDYGRAPPRRRKLIRQTLITLCIIGASVATWHWGWEWAQYLYWQRRCLTYSAQPDLVVYEAEPSAAKALLQAQEYTSPAAPTGRRIGPLSAFNSPIAAHRPAPWQNLLSRRDVAALGLPPILSQSAAICFLGELQTPSGQRRLVVVEAAPIEVDQLPGTPVASLRSYSVSLKTGSGAAKATFTPIGWSLGRIGGAPPNLRIFAGQRDPSNPSRFTIRYQAFGQESLVDGRLDDAGNVNLELPPPYPSQPDTP